MAGVGGACTLLLTLLDWIPLWGVSRGVMDDWCRSEPSGKLGIGSPTRKDRHCSHLRRTQEASPSPVTGWAILGLGIQGMDHVLLFRGPTLGMTGPGDAQKCRMHVPAVGKNQRGRRYSGKASWWRGFSVALILGPAHRIGLREATEGRAVQAHPGAPEHLLHQQGHLHQWPEPALGPDGGR